MGLALDPLRSPILLASPRRLTRGSAWHEHIPFGMFLVGLLRPRVLVELGTHHGDSYCAFCQAVQELRLEARCYAVDTWAGDAQAGLYGAEVLADLRSSHDPLYGGFSSLIQSTFDEAVASFADGSIDLLHIDGYHSYDAVAHDFQTWLPKVSPRGVVLFHDSHVREKDYGVWQLWQEVKRRYPHFEFVHGHGLGVLGVGADQEEAVRPLFALSPDEAAALRAFFFEMGHRLELQVQLAEVRGERDRLKAEVARLEEWSRKVEGQFQAVEAECSARGRALEELRAAHQEASAGYEQAVAAYEQAVAAYEQAVGRHQEEIGRLTGEYRALEAHLAQMTNHRVWRTYRALCRLVPGRSPTSGGTPGGPA